MVDIPYHTHQFDIPTASEGEIRTGVEAGKAITPDKLFPVLADKADKSTTLAGYGIVDAATKEQGQKADTAVQPAQISAVGYSGRYGDLLNKPSLGSASGLNVGTTAGTVAAGDDARIVNAAQKSITVTAGAGVSGGGTLAANIALALSSTSLASLALADTAVQPSRKLTAGTGLTGGGDFSADRTVALSAASIASLAKADTAVQPPAIANFATRAELTAGLGTKLDTGAQAADSAKLQGFTALTLPISTATQTALDGKATTVQGAKADTAVQPSDLGALATKSKVATTDIDATGSTAGGALLTRGGVWVDPSGGGDMFRATYDPNNKAADAFSMGSMVETTSAKVMTAAERTKLAGIATGATANTGTVTSVGVAVPAGLSATGAITTSGTITISYATGHQGYTTAEANKLAGIPADADKTPALAVVATTGSYGDLSGKPATFPPSPHTHTPSEVGLGNVANKTEAQMVASGAIADALGGKQPSLGFDPVKKGTASAPSTSNIISLGWATPGELHLQIDDYGFSSYWPINITGGSQSVNNMQLRSGRQVVSFNANGDASISYSLFPTGVHAAVAVVAERTAGRFVVTEITANGGFNMRLYNNLGPVGNTSCWISWVVTGY